MLNKKAEIPVIQLIAITLVTSALFIFFLFQLYKVSLIIIDEKELEQELIVSKILSESCTNEKSYSTIYKENINSNFNTCLGEYSQDHKVKIRIHSIDVNNNLNLLESIYVNTQENSFEKEKVFCTISSTKICYNQKFPILIKSAENELNKGLMSIEIIS